MKKYLSLALVMFLSVMILSACGSTAVKEIFVENIPAKEQQKTEPKNELAQTDTTKPLDNTSKITNSEQQNEQETEKLKQDTSPGKIQIDWFSVVTNASQKGNTFNLSWTDNKGKTKSLTDLGGKVYLIDVWAQWCSPCRASTPSLIELHDKYSKLGLVIIGINIDADTDLMQAVNYGKDEGLISKYTVLYDNQGGTVSGVFVQNGIPNFTLLDKNGNLLKVHTGGLVKGNEGFDEVEQIITENLE